jgi:gas vesicle protein
MLNATSNRTFIQGLKTGVCAFALASMLIAPLPSFAANENAPAAKADTQVQKNAQDETTQKRKEMVAEAVSAVTETGKRVESLG